MEEENPARRASSSKPRKRPQSRASTTSVHSTTTQSNADNPAYGNEAEMYPPGQWYHDSNSQHRQMASTSQMSPEALILQAATQMQASGQQYQIDGSMSLPMAHHMQYQNQAALHRHPLPMEQQYGGNASFTEGDSQMLDLDENGEGDPTHRAPSGGKSSTAKSSANNEIEMRALFGANRHRSLQDVAGELHGNERGPNSERTRQVFAMLWINSVCSKGKGSVPRGRVYANYASRCATERITVLNPASFGKLVRVLFPGLKTRRLGVRGESKYHYVNFNLIEDLAGEARDVSSQPPPPKPLPESRSASQDLTGEPSRPGSAVQVGTSQAPKVTDEDKILPYSSTDAGRSHSLYNLPDLGGVELPRSHATKTSLKLEFPSAMEDGFQHAEPLELPPMELYLPKGTDPDAAKSLSALYRSHCTSLVECIRYCREKTFFHLFTAFQGTLTMPVQKLFGKPEMAQWIEGCDLVTYQRMTRIVATLTLQVLPKPVMDTLKNISERLVPHIRDSFQGQPQHVLQAKESPATLFAGILDRALRVNLTAHAAANVLSNSANRDQMFHDWITMIRAKKVAECVPTRGMDDVVSILVTQIRDLLDPVQVSWDVECLTIYGNVAGRRSQASDAVDTESCGQTVMDRWVVFLRGLPDKFPYASHADIVWCVDRVGTAIMRDLTLSQGDSFGSWWVVKAWVDEMVCFLAEQGGFLAQRSGQPPIEVSKSQPNVVHGEDGQTPHPRGGNVDIDISRMSQSQPGRAPFPPTNNTKHTASRSSGGGDDSHDDSGIGIRTPEEDFPMDKFTFASAEDDGMMTEAGLAAAPAL